MTKVLTVVAQASHALVPPDTLEPVVRAIANNFVADHCAAEVMTVGYDGGRAFARAGPFASARDDASFPALFSAAQPTGGLALDSTPFGRSRRGRRLP